MLRTDLQEGLAIEFETLKNNLSSEHYELFKRVHAKQLTTFWEGMEAKENRNLDHITTVMWDQEEDCLKVSFDDGETWRFTKNEEWF